MPLVRPEEKRVSNHLDTWIFKQLDTSESKPLYTSVSKQFDTSVSKQLDTQETYCLAGTVFCSKLCYQCIYHLASVVFGEFRPCRERYLDAISKHNNGNKHHHTSKISVYLWIQILETVPINIEYMTSSVINIYRVQFISFFFLRISLRTSLQNYQMELHAHEPIFFRKGRFFRGFNLSVINMLDQRLKNNNNEKSNYFGEIATSNKMLICADWCREQ